MAPLPVRVIEKIFQNGPWLMSPTANHAMPPVSAVRDVRLGRRRRRDRVGVSPAADHQVLVNERQEYRRAERDTAPLGDPLIELGDDFAYLLLTAQARRRLGEPLYFLAQPQRGGQELFSGHALPAQVLPQPRLGGVLVRGAAGNRLARARQVVEGT